MRDGLRGRIAPQEGLDALSPLGNDPNKSILEVAQALVVL
jgi:hypothetical protein